MDTSKFERAVLVPAVGLRPLELQTVLAARLPARQTNRFVRLLSSALPAPELKHFKRVRRSSSDGHVEVLLCKSCAATNAAPCSSGGCRPPSSENGGAAAPATAPAPAAAAAPPPPPPPAAPEAAAAAHVGDTAKGPACSDQQAASHTTGTEHEACIAELPPDLAQEMQRHGAELHKVLVPANPPQIRQQWEQWSAQFWPMAWRAPDTKVQAAAERIEATQDEQAYYESHMAHVLRACSHAAPGTSGPAGSHPPCNAARIVAPSTNLVVGQGVDCRHQHPLQHATMLALAAASAWEREQWPDVAEGSASHHQPCAGDSRVGGGSHHQPCATAGEGRAGGEGGGPSCNEAGMGTQAAVSCQQRSLGIHRAAGGQQGGCSVCDGGGSDAAAAATAAGSGASGCQGSSRAECEGGAAHKRQRTDHDHHTSSHDDSQHHHQQGGAIQPDGHGSSQQASQTHQQGVHTHQLHSSQASAPRPTTAQALGMSKPYLCTGYDCFIAKEPCIMCAMALVHSRVARVIMCHSDAGGGALGGRLQLMSHSSLNHHYKVYKMGLRP